MHDKSDTCHEPHYGNSAAGVTDAAEAQAGIEFAKRFELIKGDESKRLRLQEVDLSDESSIAEALPRFACTSLCCCIHQIWQMHMTSYSRDALNCISCTAPNSTTSYTLNYEILLGCYPRGKGVNYSPNYITSSRECLAS